MYVWKGIVIMKYVVNHPYLFRSYDSNKDLEEQDTDTESSEEEQGYESLSEQEKNNGLYVNLTLAFLLGFFQLFISLILEVMSLIYISALGSYVFILICYGTIGTMASFERIYASSLKNHPVKEAVGKQLFIKYKRYMGYVKNPWNCQTEGCNRLTDKFAKEYAMDELEVNTESGGGPDNQNAPEVPTATDDLLSQYCKACASGTKKGAEDDTQYRYKWTKCKLEGCNFAIISEVRHEDDKAQADGPNQLRRTNVKKQLYCCQNCQVGIPEHGCLNKYDRAQNKLLQETPDLIEERLSRPSRHREIIFKNPQKGHCYIRMLRLL